MATITRPTQAAQRTAVSTRTVAQPAKVQVRTAQPVRQAAKPTPGVREVAGFKVMSGITIPPKKAFGGKKGIFNDMFSQLQEGDCVEVVVDEGKKNTSKMNSLYNAARRIGADITIRIHDNGDNGTGGVLYMWFNGYKEATQG